jgi:hypothetical protein
VAGQLRSPVYRVAEGERQGAGFSLTSTGVLPGAATQTVVVDGLPFIIMYISEYDI